MNTSSISNLLKPTIQKISLICILSISTGYAYLNAVLNDTYGDSLLPLLLFFGLTYYWSSKNVISKDQSYKLLIFPIIYLIMGLMSVYLPFSQFTSIPWFNDVISRLFFAITITLFLIHYSESDRKWLTIAVPTIFLFTCIFIILQQNNLVSKLWFESLTPFPVIIKGMGNPTTWNNKYTANWLVLFTWGVIGLLFYRSSIKNWFFITCVFLIAGITIFLLPSEGAELAFVCSIILFFIIRFFPLQKHYYFYLFTISFSYLIPTFFLLFTVFHPIIPSENPLKGLGGMERTIGLRKYIYAHSCELIKDNPLLGYGAGSTWSLPFPHHSNVNKAWVKNRLPGGHPHNLFYAFLLEFGILGAIFLFALNTAFYNFIYKTYTINPSIVVALPLLLSFQIITSLSFSLFQADVVLLFFVFLLMMKLVLIPDNE